MKKNCFVFILLFSGQALLSILNAQTSGAYLGDLTWTDAEKRLKEAPLVIIPFGAGAKEHGPHLPMNADAVVLEYLCQKAVESLPVIVAPPILHGWFPPFREFPGTEIADPHIFQEYIHQVALSLIKQDVQRIVFLNTGIFRATGLPLAIIAREIRVETGTPCLVVSWDDLETSEVETFQEQKSGGHADEIETSIHLFLQPNLVHMDRAVNEDMEPRKRGYSGYKPGTFSRNPKDPAYSETGILGDPRLATAEKGKRVLDIMVREWLKTLEGFSKTKLLEK